jgi:hypothetical protein
VTYEGSLKLWLWLVENRDMSVGSFRHAEGFRIFGIPMTR